MCFWCWNYFFVKTHNSEPALAPGFCFITFYWSRKKEHIITLLLHVFSWLKRATSTLCKQKSWLCCLRTGRWERQDEGLSQTIKETHHTKQAWGEWAGGLGNGGKKSFAHIHRLVQVLQVSVGKVIWAGMCQVSLAERFLLRGPFSDFMHWWCFYKTKGVNQVVEGILMFKKSWYCYPTTSSGLPMCRLLLPVSWGDRAAVVIISCRGGTEAQRLRPSAHIAEPGSVPNVCIHFTSLWWGWKPFSNFPMLLVSWIWIFKNNFFEAWLMYDVVLISAVQRNLNFSMSDFLQVEHRSRVNW